MKSAYELYIEANSNGGKCAMRDCSDFVPLTGGGICKKSGKIILADYLPKCKYKQIPKE